MFIKYCGFTREEDLEYALSLNINAVGFIFYEKSKRFVTPERAKKLITSVNTKNVKKVGIFCKTQPKDILEASKTAGLDTLQIYEPNIFDQLSKHYPLIRAYRINNPSDLTEVKECPERDILLLDSFHVNEMGGTGHSFDWKLLNNFPHLAKTLIAGGITVDNISLLLNTVSPYGIDISSGIEDSPGIKSSIKMKNLISKINNLKN